MTTFIAAYRSPGEALNTKVTNCRPQTRSTDAATGGGDQRRFIFALQNSLWRALDFQRQAGTNCSCYFIHLRMN